MNPEGSRWQQWTVRALSDERGTVREFQSVGRDITEIHEAENGLRQHIADMEFLSRKAREFLELPAGADIYRAILDGMRELVPFSTITISTFDHRSRTITVRSVWSEDVETIFRQLTGEDLIGKVFRVTDPDAFAAMTTGKIHRIPGDVYYTMFGEVPLAISQQLEQLLEMKGDKYAVGLMSRDRLLGAIMIAPKTGIKLRHEDLIGIYLHQASIALSQRLDSEALRQSEEKFRGIIEDQTEFITRFAPDGTLIFVNAPLCRVAGMDQQDLVGRSFYSMIPENDRKDLLDGLQSLTAVNPKMEIRHRFIDPTGHFRWFQWTNRAIFDEQGHIVEYDGIGRDVTDLQEATARIRNHPAEIRFLAEQARALSGIQEPGEILAFTARNIRAILPNSLVGISSYSPAMRTLLIQYLEGNPEDIRILNNELGHDPVGITLPFDPGPDLQSLLTGRQIAAAPGIIGLFISSACQNKNIRTRIDDRCNFGRSYVMGLPSSDGTIDSVLLQLKAGTDLQSPELVEAAISQAGLALARAQYR
jgi:PAS domain S-box-containing protein